MFSYFCIQLSHIYHSSTYFRVHAERYKWHQDQDVLDCDLLIERCLQQLRMFLNDFFNIVLKCMDNEWSYRRTRERGFSSTE